MGTNLSRRDDQRQKRTEQSEKRWRASAKFAAAEAGEMVRRLALHYSAHPDAEASENPSRRTAVTRGFDRSTHYSLQLGRRWLRKIHLQKNCHGAGQQFFWVSESTRS
jgi:hypothetical protein